MSIRFTAIVTGGSSGIGERVCAHLLAAGAAVINIDIRQPGKAQDGNYHFFHADLSDPVQTREVARKVTDSFDVNCLVNNAGTPRPALVADATEADFDYLFNLNVRTALILAKAVIPAMKAGHFGRIVSMSSRVILGKHERTIYAGTKSALVGFTRTWALELGPFGITVNAIAPGPIMTELLQKNNPPEVRDRIIAGAVVGRAGTPDDVARAVMFFASPDNGFVTGQVLHVCGGTSLGAAPW